jgi:hypothetical protein
MAGFIGLYLILQVRDILQKNNVRVYWIVLVQVRDIWQNNVRVC